MIAFEELVSALDRWRIRNGLPVVTGDLPMVAAAPRTTASQPAYAAPAAAAATYAQPAPRTTGSQPAYAAPAAAPAPVGESSDVLSLGDGDVLEDEELYDNEGNDFAMSFDAGGGNPVGSVSGSIGGGWAPVAAPAAYQDPYAAQPGYDQAQDEYDPDAYPATPPPAAPAADPYAAQPPDLYDDPAYDPPGNDTLDRPGTETLDADDDIIDEATVVGDDPRKR